MTRQVAEGKDYLLCFVIAYKTKPIISDGLSRLQAESMTQPDMLRANMGNLR